MNTDHQKARLPLFPLHTVLFPGGKIPLRIFEPRYIDMVRTSLREDSGFGIAAIKRGREVGTPAEPHGFGTLATVGDWNQGKDGLLNITVIGTHRFQVHGYYEQNDGALHADVTWLPNYTQPLPAEYAELAQLLAGVSDHEWSPEGAQWGDAAWIAHRLAERLPLSLARKVELLSLDQPVKLLAAIKREIAQRRAAQ